MKHARPPTPERTYEVLRVQAAHTYRAAHAYVAQWLEDHAERIAALDAAHPRLDIAKIDDEIASLQVRIAGTQSSPGWSWFRDLTEIHNCESRIRSLEAIRANNVQMPKHSAAKWIIHRRDELTKLYAIASTVTGDTITLAEREVLDLHTMREDVVSWLRRMPDVRRIEGGGDE